MLSRPRYYSYQLTAGAAVPVLSLAEIKEHLRIDPLDTSEDTYLEALERTVVLFAEKYTKRDFINKNYLTKRDSFTNNTSAFPDPNVLTLRRSKLQAVISVNYYLDGVLTLLPATEYQVQQESDWGFIVPPNNQSWPEADDRYNAIEIEFTAGYGPTAADVPQDLKLALLQHIAKMYENRGDCDEAACGCSENFPTIQSKHIYDLYRIWEIYV